MKCLEIDLSTLKLQGFEKFPPFNVTSSLDASQLMQHQKIEKKSLIMNMDQMTTKYNYKPYFWSSINQKPKILKLENLHIFKNDIRQ